MSATSGEHGRSTGIAALLEGREAFLRYLRRRVGSADDAEDVLQAALAKAVAEERLDGKEDVRRWFFRVLRNAVVDGHRRRDAGRRALEARGRTTAFEASEADDRAVCRCITALLPSLSPAYADLLRRVDLDGADPATAAKDLGMTGGAVRVKLHRARAALKRSVLAACRACAAHGCLDCTCKRP